VERVSSAALSGYYTNLKIVAGRKVVQIVIEVDISKADEVIQLLGLPNPDNEPMVALARMATADTEIRSKRSPGKNLQTDLEEYLEGTENG
jgi:hypothetical protein